MLNDVKGVANVVRAFAPGMLDRRTRGVPGSRGDFAAVVNVTHDLDPPEAARNAAYRASRAAIGALTAALAGELDDAAADRDRVSDARRRTRVRGGDAGGEKTRNHEDREHFPGGGNLGGQRGREPPIEFEFERDRRRPRGFHRGRARPRRDARTRVALGGRRRRPHARGKGDAAARDWARAAVPFILGLTPEVTGASLHVPAFPPG